MAARLTRAEDAPEIVRLAGLMYASMGVTITPEWSALAATEMVRRFADADPEFRRRGLARAIMVALLDWFEAARVPVVELHATDEGEPLYRSLGFGQEGGFALRRRSGDSATRCW
jgi:GNAT superfamily N-acetyltransferase